MKLQLTKAKCSFTSIALASCNSTLEKVFPHIALLETKTLSLV